MAHPAFDKLPVNLNNMHSSTACGTKNNGIYYGRMYYQYSGGSLLQPIDLDLGRTLPESAEPASLLGWLHAEAKSRQLREVHLNERRIVAVMLARMCEARRHEGPPDEHRLSARLEWVRGLFVARAGVEPFEVRGPAEIQNRDDGIYTLRRPIVGTTAVANTIILPARSRTGTSLPVKDVIELHPASRGNAAHGALHPAEHGYVEEFMPFDQIWPPAPSSPAPPAETSAPPPPPEGRPPQS